MKACAEYKWVCDVGSSDQGVPDEQWMPRFWKGWLLSEPAVKLQVSPCKCGIILPERVMECAEKEFNTRLQQHTPLVALICFFAGCHSWWLRESERISEQKSSPAFECPPEPWCNMSTVLFQSIVASRTCRLYGSLTFFLHDIMAVNFQGRLRHWWNQFLWQQGDNLTSSLWWLGQRIHRITQRAKMCSHWSKHFRHEKNLLWMKKLA